MKRLLTILAVLLMAGVSQAALTYSGADISAGNGTMTITCTSGSTILWELDLTRQTGTTALTLSRFTAYGGTFNYAGPAGLGLGLWTVENNTGVFTEVSKTGSAYSFQMYKAGAAAGFDTTTVFTINDATATGTHWTAVHTVTNVGTVAAKPYNLFDWSLRMNALSYNPTETPTADLTGTSGYANRYHEDTVTGDDYLYLVNENVDRNATGLNVAANLAGKVTVLNNALTAANGMVAGLSFEAMSDTWAYYPADNIGDADVYGNSAAYLRYLGINATPREFMGHVRADHVNLNPGQSYVGNASLDINITNIPEPATMGLLGLGLFGLVVSRKKK